MFRGYYYIVGFVLLPVWEEYCMGVYLSVLIRDRVYGILRRVGLFRQVVGLRWGSCEIVEYSSYWCICMSCMLGYEKFRWFVSQGVNVHFLFDIFKNKQKHLKVLLRVTVSMLMN